MENFTKQDKKVFSKAFLLCSLFLLIVSVLQIIAGGLIGAFKPELVQNHIVMLLITFLPQYLIGYPLIIFMFKKLMPCESVQPVAKMSAGNILTTFCSAYAGMYLINIATVLTISLISMLAGKTAQNPLLAVMQPGATGVSFIVTSIFVCICAPIFEELLFRKIIIDRLEKYGQGIAVIVSAVAFGLFHMNIYQIPYAILLGFVFAITYVKTKNILYPILLHLMVNTLGNVATAALGNMVLLGILGISIIAVLIVGIVFFFKNRKKGKLEVVETDIPKNKRIGFAFLNPGAIIYVLATLAFTVFSFVIMLI